jgi:hypothetical protein
MSTITIRFLSRDSLTIDFNPEEPTWSFSKRVGEHLGEMRDDGITSRYKLLYNRRGVNTFINRLEPIGSLISDPSKGLCACLWDLMPGQSAIWRGNASPLGADRTICAICLGDIQTFTAGRDDNPLIPVALKCGHAFHKGCLSEWLKSSADSACVLCRAPIE